MSRPELGLVRLTTLLLMVSLGAGRATAGVTFNYSWEDATTTFYTGDLTGEDGLWQDAFEEAARRWNDTPTRFRLHTVRSPGTGFCSSSGNNSTRWSTTNCGDTWGANTLGATTTWFIGDKVSKSDIAFNSFKDFSVYDGPLDWNNEEFRRVAVHELGHAIGLDHAQLSNVIMSALANDAWLPQLDDVNTLRGVYGSLGHTLTVVSNGDGQIEIEPTVFGTGVVYNNNFHTLNYSSFLDCPANQCDKIIQDGLRLTVRAVADPGATFTGWSQENDLDNTIELAPFHFKRVLTANFSGGLPRGNMESFSADLNGDNKTDILVRNSVTGGWYAYLMNGRSIMSQGPVAAISNPVWEPVAVADLNADNKDDLLLRNTETGQWYAYLMNGIGILVSGFVGATTNPQWHPVGVKDLNGDQKSDILLRNSSSGQWYAYQMNGLNIQASAFINATSNQLWEIEAVKDLDGDNRSDLLLRHAQSGQWYSLLLNGSNIISQGFIPATNNLDWVSVAVEDMSGENGADLLLRNRNTGQWYAYSIAGAAVSSSGFLPAVANLDWQLLRLADFNADGKGDILIRNSLTGRWYIYLMNEQSVISSGFLGATTNRDWLPRITGDFSGDNAADVLLRHNETGSWYIYLIDGTRFFDNGFLNAVGNQHWQVPDPATTP